MPEDAARPRGHAAIAEATDYDRDVVASLQLYYSEANPDYAARFFGRSRSEVGGKLRERLDETDTRSCLVLLTMLEAAFRVDFEARCGLRKRDAVSRACRVLHGEAGARVRLEDILAIWRWHHAGAARIINDLQGAFKYRHWLAHGRYWTPKLGRTYTYELVCALTVATLGTLPFHESAA